MGQDFLFPSLLKIEGKAKGKHCRHSLGHQSSKLSAEILQFIFTNSSTDELSQKMRSLMVLSEGSQRKFFLALGGLSQCVMVIWLGFFVGGVVCLLFVFLFFFFFHLVVGEWQRDTRNWGCRVVRGGRRIQARQRYGEILLYLCIRSFSLSLSDSLV